MENGCHWLWHDITYIAGMIPILQKPLCFQLKFTFTNYHEVVTYIRHMSAALVTVWLPGQCDVTWNQGLLSGWGHCECLVDRGCLQEKDCSTEYNCLI